VLNNDSVLNVPRFLLNTKINRVLLSESFSHKLLDSCDRHFYTVSLLILSLVKF
jgi:hypothetical protein